MSERDAARAYVDAFDAAWSDYGDGQDHSDPIPRPRDWSASVRQWRQRGLELDELLQFVDQAMENGRLRRGAVFRYVAGCAWNRIGESEP